MIIIGFIFNGFYSDGAAPSSCCSTGTSFFSNKGSEEEDLKKDANHERMDIIHSRSHSNIIFTGYVLMDK